MLAVVFFQLCCAIVAAEKTEPFGYLCQPASCVDRLSRCPLEPYQPQPGDMVFFADESLLWKFCFAMAGTGQPHHVGLVFALPDGRPAMAESGPHDGDFFGISEMMPNLCQYEQEGRVWVRRRCVPLTPEQSAQLTAFCLAQEGKKYALHRLAGQLTPFRSRGPLRTCFLGGPHGNRHSYICSEFVMEAFVYVGLLDPATTRPVASYPRDMFFDHSLNPYLHRHLKLAPDWDPPARWLSACDQVDGF